MNEEERQRQMDFILSQQAQFAANIQSLQEAQAQTNNTLAQTNDALNRLTEITLTGFQELTDRIGAVADAQIRSEERISELAVKLAETDERLNNLIIVVERHISEGHNGKTP